MPRKNAKKYPGDGSSPQRGSSFMSRDMRIPRWRTSSLSQRPPRARFIIISMAKDALVGTLAYVFDEKYEALMDTMDPDLGAMEKLVTSTMSSLP